MRICDRCGIDHPVEGWDNILLGNEHQSIDLCKPCMEEVVNFATHKEITEIEESPDNGVRRRGRPKKNTAAVV